MDNDSEAPQETIEASPTEEVEAPPAEEVGPPPAIDPPAPLALSKPVLVICGPSGVGKGTLIAKLRSSYGDLVGFSVSHCTRGPRAGERDGVDYHFTAHADMQPRIDAGEFLEHAEVHGELYGTSCDAVRDVDAEGKMCVLDIDIAGLRQVRRSAVRDEVIAIFVAPPSHEALEQRLRDRGTETEEKIQKRLHNSVAEIEASSEPGLFTAVIVNDDLEEAYTQLEGEIRKHAPGILPDVSDVKKAEGESYIPTEATGGGEADAPPRAEGEPLSGDGDGASPDMGVRPYMEATVVPLLRKALRALNCERPEDPVQYLADYLLANKAETLAAHT